MLRAHWRFIRSKKVATEMVKNPFAPGAYVKFKAKKHVIGYTYGRVAKINRSSVGVEVPGFPRGWRVHPSFLKASTKEEFEKFAVNHPVSEPFLRTAGED